MVFLLSMVAIAAKVYELRLDRDRVARSSGPSVAVKVEALEHIIQARVEHDQ